MATSDRPIDEASLKPDSAMCLAVARAIAARDGLGTIESFDCPDHHTNTAGAPQGKKFVDLVASTSEAHELALEHTVVESHEGQMHEGRQIVKLLIPLKDSLSGQLPDDRTYTLMVGKGAVADRDLDPDDVQSAVGKWVAEAAPRLPAGGPGVAPSHCADAGPPDLPVPVRLYAWPPDRAAGGGHLTVSRGVAESDEEQARARAERFSRALDAKLPKLLEQRSARTILVLEDRDIAASNLWLAREAARTAADGRELPDTIVVVESFNGCVDYATVICDQGEWLDDLHAGALDMARSVVVPPAGQQRSSE